jgi:hypothetical protein
VAEDYFLEIEAHFVKRRGTPFVLNAKDWALMKKWHDEQIPLAVVIEAIDTVFDKNEAKGRKMVSSLGYLRHAVSELWEERRELQIGSESITPEESPEAALERLASALDASAEPAVRGYAAAVRGLAKERSVPRVEDRLMEIEDEMIAAVLATAAAAEELREEASRIDSGRVDEKTRARAIEANLRRLVRDRFGIPRLTLF